MDPKGYKQRLAAILYADVAGYSRLTEEDPDGTHRLLSAYLDIITGTVESYTGKVVHYAGDAVLAEFSAAVDALGCAAEIQRILKARNEPLPDDRKLQFRVGVNVGDVIVDRNDIYGDGVNVAARLEGLADSGGICISGTAYDAIGAKLPYTYEFLGEKQVKNVSRPVRAYRVVLEPSPSEPAAVYPSEAKRGWPRWPIIAGALLLFVLFGAVTVVGLFTADAPEKLSANTPPPRSEVSPPSSEAFQLELPDQPSIAVLPFANISGRPDEDYFSDGITLDLITELSRISGIFVIASNTVFTYKGAPANVRRVGKELGVRYVLEGSLQKAGDRVRINAQLVDAEDGHQLWADRYDRNLTDVLALQDEVAKRIVSALSVRLTADEEQRLRVREGVDPEAYDMLLRGLEGLNEFTRERNLEARSYFEKAIALDPTYARAYADVAITHFVEVAFGFAEAPDEALERGLSYARKALEVDPSLPQAHFALAGVLLRMKRFEEAAAAARRATEVRPNYADGYAQLGNVLTYAGKPEEGVKAIRRAMRLNPRYPAFYSWFLGHAYFLMARYEDAVEACNRVVERNPNFPGARMTLAAAYGMLGRTEEAEWEAQEILQLRPGFSLRQERDLTYFKVPAHSERYIEGLRKAGLPEQPPKRPQDKPSIAVLPFENLSGDPEQEYFVDGMTEDLITDLSKVSGLFVIGRSSVFEYKGRTVRAQKVSSELGVRYVLEGSVRKAKEQLRITARLLDATTGLQLWAERYDRELRDVFTLQDEVTVRIVSALAVELTESERDSIVRKYTGSVQAYDYFLRGLDHYGRRNKEDNGIARDFFARAIEIDPGFARAYASAALTHSRDVIGGWSDSPERSLRQAEALVQQALAIDESLPQGHFASGTIHLHAKDHAQALAAVEKALAHDPNYADGYALLAEILEFAGRPEDSLEVMEKALRLNPGKPAAYSGIIGRAYFVLGRYHDAIEAFEQGLDRNPGHQRQRMWLAASYARLGRTEEAAWEAEELLNLAPDFSLQKAKQVVPYKDPAHLNRLLDGLRGAGIPST